jgi:hypothetical protein
MVAITAAVLCISCGGRLARDHHDTICSPCRRTGIENSARSAALITRDNPEVARAFDAGGLHGVADHLDCTPEEALDVLLNSQLLPFVSPMRRLMLRRLIALRDSSHIAAAEALSISRWTVATYRRQLRINSTVLISLAECPP